MHAQSCPMLCDPWTIACQAPLSVGFSRKEYWVGCHFLPPPRDLPDPRMELISPALAGGFFTTESAGVKTAWGILKQESAHFFWKGQTVSTFRFLPLQSLLLRHESNTDNVWMNRDSCPQRTGDNFVQGLWFANPCSKAQVVQKSYFWVKRQMTAILPLC